VVSFWLCLDPLKGTSDCFRHLSELNETQFAEQSETVLLCSANCVSFSSLRCSLIGWLCRSVHGEEEAALRLEMLPVTVAAKGASAAFTIQMAVLKFSCMPLRGGKGKGKGGSDVGELTRPLFAAESAALGALQAVSGAAKQQPATSLIEKLAKHLLA